MKHISKSKSGKLILLVENKGFECTQAYVNGVIQIGIDKFTNENVNAIVATRKQNIVMLQREVFDSEQRLMDQVASFRKQGYSVTYVKANNKIN